MAFALSPGQSGETLSAPALIAKAVNFGARCIVGDKGYDSDALRKHIASYGVESVIPYRITSRHPQPLDKPKYKKRNRVERFIGRIKENRRVATRYEKTDSNFSGFVLLAAIKDWLGFIC